MKVAEEKEKRLIFELKQEQLRNTELEVRLQHSEIMLQKVCQKRKQAEYSVEILRKEMDVKNDECEECRVRAKKSETEARKYEQEMEKLMGNMQQELASRTQQVQVDIVGFDLGLYIANTTQLSIEHKILSEGLMQNYGFQHTKKELISKLFYLDHY